MSDKSIIIDTDEGIDFFRLAQTKARLKLEIVGMKCRGPSAYSQAKEWYGLKGNRQRVLAQMEEMIQKALEDRRIQS
jgi:hypothetical protein